MKQVSISEAKAQLSELIAKATAGEEIVICNHNVPVVILSPINPVAKRRKLGLWKGRFTVPEDFNEPMSDEELAEWEKPIS